MVYESRNDPKGAEQDSQPLFKRFPPGTRRFARLYDTGALGQTGTIPGEDPVLMTILLRLPHPPDFAG